MTISLPYPIIAPIAAYLSFLGEVNILSERLTYTVSQDERNKKVNVILYTRDGRPYSAVTALIPLETNPLRSGRVDIGIHRSQGGSGSNMGRCELLGEGGCNFESVGVEDFPEKLHEQVRALAGELRELHPTMAPERARLLELKAMVRELVSR